MLNRRWLLGVVVGMALPAATFAQFSGGGGPGGGGGRRMGGMFGDPNAVFNMISQGRDVIVVDQVDDRWKWMLTPMLQSQNITNGQISREQFVEGMKQLPAMRGGMGPGRAGPGGGGGSAGPDQAQIDQWADARFDRLDKDKDGMLSAEEMDDALRAEKEKWDKDGNGFIDRTEYRAYFAARILAIEQGREAAAKSDSEDDNVRKPTIYRSGKLPPDLPPWFTQLDTDGDLQVGLYEWKKSGRSIKEFKEYDRNGDGLITIDEVLLVVRLQAKAKGDGQALASGSPGGMGGFPNRGGFGPPGATGTFQVTFPRGDTSGGAPAMGYPGRGNFPGGNGGQMTPGGDRMRGNRGGPGGFQKGFQPPGGSDQTDSPNGGGRYKGGRPTRGVGE